ncbi:hypothetical protein MKHDV_01261 [Halodesulfovibrio sp. MK-HDV]|nr:hypothetical protein MKHDV_01261 [Halodesulfovibrio sp. MK-HDV]
MGKRRYRKISVCIWNDAKFLALSHDAKLVVFFMLTHQDLTQLGALRATIPGLACELGMKLETFGKAFEEVLHQGIVEYDEKLLFWFPNFLKHNLPESPNVVKSWHYGYRQLPETPLRSEILLGVRELVATLTQGFREAFTCTFAEELAETCPNQRAENREQEKEKRVGDSPAPSSQPASPNASPDTYSPPKQNVQSLSSFAVKPKNLSNPFTPMKIHPTSLTELPNETSPQNFHESSLTPDNHNRSREGVPLAGMQGEAPLPAGGNKSAAGKISAVGNKPTTDDKNIAGDINTIDNKTTSDIKNTEENPSASGAKTSPPNVLEPRIPCPYERIREAYNVTCTRLPKCREITPLRKARLKSVWNSGLDRKNLAWWERYFALVHESAFLAGENDRGWTANFDWIVKPANMIKIEEGNYLPKQGKPQKGAGVSATNRAVYESMMQRG